MLKDGTRAKINKNSVDVLPIFNMIQKLGDVSEHDMFNTYNMGIGPMLAVSRDSADAAIAANRKMRRVGMRCRRDNRRRKRSGHMLNIGVLVSGGGTNLQALIDAQNGGIIKRGRIVTVVSDREGAYALERAAKAGIDGHSILKKDYAEKADFDKALVEYLKSKNVDIVVLAGFLSILGKDFISAYRDRIVNIHPSLIPSFCGDGFLRT